MPTLPGWLLVGSISLLPCVLWTLLGESFLRACPIDNADVLIVEGWIGTEAIKQAQDEYERGGYRWIVTAGGSTKAHWGGPKWNYAEVAADLLRRLGTPPEAIVVAPSEDTSRHRTYEMARGVQNALIRRGIKVHRFNVFTQGVHARRSCLTFRRVLGKDVGGGAVSFLAPEDKVTDWWQSSVRTQDFLKETIAYPFELLMGSARFLD